MVVGSLNSQPEKKPQNVTKGLLMIAAQDVTG